MHHHNLDHLCKALSAEIKNLKHGHEIHNINRRNLATILQMKDHENETMKVKYVFKSYGKNSKWFSACPSWNSKT
jgi:hypothetical protein